MLTTVDKLSTYFVFLLYGCLIAGSLWICLDCSIFPLDGIHDSLRYLGMAETIQRGEWLGNYNYLTLIRLPVYSCFLALNACSGWPLHVTQHVFYLLSITVLAAALRACQLSKLQVILVFAGCAFHPVAFYPSLFVLTEGIYTSLATGVLAGCLGLLGSIGESALIYSSWLIVTSFCLAVFWYIRPEAIWILPVLGVFILILFLRASRMRQFYSIRVPRGRIVLALAVPAVATLSLGWTIALLNERYYGIRVTHELAEPNFVDFGRLLTRLAPEFREPYIPVSSEALQTAYRVSPHTAMLKPFLSQQTGGKGWSEFGCDIMGICDELAGGWSMWAIRDAVNSIGLYGNAKQASAFYGAAAQELSGACKEGRIRCSDNPTGNLLAPPLTLNDGPRLLQSFFRVSAQTLNFQGLVEALKACDEIYSHQDLVPRYNNITHDQRPGPPLTTVLNVGLHLSVYSWIQWTGIAIMLILGLYDALRRFQNKDGKSMTREPSLIPVYDLAGWLMLIFVCSRLVLVSYIDAMSFPCHIRYLFVIYPALTALVITAFSFPVRRKKISK